MIFNDMVVENRLFLNKMRTKKYNILYEKENDFKLTYNILYCALLFEFYAYLMLTTASAFICSASATMRFVARALASFIISV